MAATLTKSQPAVMDQRRRLRRCRRPWCCRPAQLDGVRPAQHDHRRIALPLAKETRRRRSRGRRRMRLPGRPVVVGPQDWPLACAASVIADRPTLGTPNLASVGPAPRIKRHETAAHDESRRWGVGAGADKAARRDVGRFGPAAPPCVTCRPRSGRPRCRGGGSRIVMTMYGRGPASRGPRRPGRAARKAAARAAACWCRHSGPAACVLIVIGQHRIPVAAGVKFQGGIRQ